jgi:ankyrin repeat protein
MRRFFKVHLAVFAAAAACHGDPEGTDERIGKFFDAIAGGDVETVRSFLKQDPRLASSDASKSQRYGSPPLLLGARYGNAEIVELLLKNGANPNTKDWAGLSPLHVAAERGHPSLIRSLVEHGGEVNGEDSGHWTPLSRAANRAVADALLAQGANLEWKNRLAGEATLLHSAASRGNAELAEWLVEHGAAVDGRANGEETPLHWAARHGQSEVADSLLRRGADVNAASQRGETPLQSAIRWADFEEIQRGNTPDQSIFRVLLSHGARSGLEESVWLGHADAVRDLLSKELSMATATTARAEGLLAVAVRRKQPDVVRVLLDNGANIDALDARGEPLLHAAAIAGSEEVARVLLERGFDPNRRDPAGALALHWALAKSHAAVADSLLAADSRVDVAAESVGGNIHRGDASDSRDLIAEELRLVELKKTPTHIQWIPPPAFAAGDTPLHVLSKPTYVTTLRAVRSGMDWGQSRLARELVTRGAVVDATNQWGQTALHYATALLRNEALVETLLELGADPQLRTASGLTALDLARQVGADDIRRRLEEVRGPEPHE